MIYKLYERCKQGRVNMETFYTTTIEVGLMFDDYINQFDSSLDFVNLDELLNTNQNHGINVYAPLLLLTQLVNNFILLFPILYEKNNEPKYKFSEMDEIVRKKVPEFYWCTDSNGEYLLNKGKYVFDTNSKPFLHFRNHLAHGSYKLLRENNDIFVTYHYKPNKHKNEIIYKKISVRTLMKLCNELIKQDFDYSNRFAVALVNSMKVLYELIMRFNNRELNIYPYSRWTYDLDCDFLKEPLIVNEHNVFTLINDLKFASSANLFYSAYQYYLEQILGPNLYLISSKSDVHDSKTKIEDDVIMDMHFRKYFNFSSLNLNDLIVGITTGDAKPLIKTDVMRLFIEIYNKQLQAYEDGDISYEEFLLFEKRLLLREANFKNNYMILSIIHHIRNSFVHGNAKLVDDKLDIIDYLPRSNETVATHYNSYDLDTFRELFCGANLRKVEKYIAQRTA